MTTTLYTKRYICRVVLEAVTPLAIGSGEKDFLTDATVVLDVNGLPYIPATSLVGVIRHSLEDKGLSMDKILGFQDGNKGMGARVIFSEAKILDSKEHVCDGMLDAAKIDDPLLIEYFNLPIRQHVKIDERGVAVDNGKFDNQIVYAGTRFCFEMECFLKEKEDEQELIDELKAFLKKEIFRLGSGTRNGLGKVKVCRFQERELDLQKKQEDLNAYLRKSASLNDETFWEGIKVFTFEDNNESYKTKYKLSLTPSDFFLFGSGYGDTNSDMNAVTESKVVWKNKTGEIEKNKTLIPASSIKGALRHRVAFHYNKKKGLFVGNADAKSGNNNYAVQTLFGYENQKERKQVRGILVFSDIIENVLEGKILNHVSIDRFTGGAIEGHLFAERPLYRGANEKPYEVEVIVTQSLKDKDVIFALEQSLKDICTGMLPLGGGVNRGNGVFKGDLYRIEDNKEEKL